MLVDYDSSSDTSISSEDVQNETQIPNITKVIRKIDENKDGLYISMDSECMENLDKECKMSSANHFKNKFEMLKLRRIKSQESQTSSVVSIEEKIMSDKKRDPMRKKYRKEKEKIKELNSCIPLTFQVCNEYDPHNLKKSKIEKDLDAAIAAKDFQLAEDINKEMIKRSFATTVKSSIEAHNHIKLQRKKEQRRHLHKKEKLQWSFNQKQRWETKGNM
ncbi:protein FAM204A isoform X4 [Hydra vulgaris]|uniref:Protein FAM204A isoform X4 n=1 Tax=Hydra vulgaris TaxID=6087 RepID=A0ABM4CGI1_HYDVU